MPAERVPAEMGPRDPCGVEHGQDVADAVGCRVRRWVAQPAPQVFRRPLDAPIAWLGASKVGIEECFTLPTLRERGRAATERNDAIDFLKEMLSSGPVPSSEILTQARAQGFSERTLRRARKMLAVKAYKTIDKMWMWSMPEEELSGGQVNNSANGHLRA